MSCNLCFFNWVFFCGKQKDFEKGVPAFLSDIVGLYTLPGGVFWSSFSRKGTDFVAFNLTFKSSVKLRQNLICDRNGKLEISAVQRDVVL
jgi:hypothetical protein